MLAPVSRMVESARELSAADPGWSLGLAGTSDELDDLDALSTGCCRGCTSLTSGNVDSAVMPLTNYERPSLS